MFIAKGLSKIGTSSVILIFMMMLLFFSLPVSWAADSLLPATTEHGKIKLVIGKSIILKRSEQVKRVSIADPEIASFVLLSPFPPSKIYLIGKTAGITNLTLWQNKNKVSAIYDLDVVYDISRLKQKLQEVLPDETDLRVIATQDTITLSGTISSAANLSQTLALAEAYAPNGKVCNMVQVAGVHQVMLEVRVAEMSKSLINRLGINFTYNRGPDFAISSIGGLTGPLGETISDSVNSLFRFHKGTATWTGFVDALKEDGLVKILAKPTLMALSGQTASFLAGGEVPIPVPSDEDIGIEYHSFGVSLSFSPTVLSENKISIEVAPKVSEIDYSIGMTYMGFVVPGFTTREASTTVELADGQSFAIAGLLNERIKDKISKFPLLGDIPVLGALFRSRAFQKNETELIIIVTPHLVKPLDLAKQTLPTDFYIEPDDSELFILGLMEGREKDRPSIFREEMDGDFGHAIPYPD